MFYRCVLKRVLDIIFALLGLIVLAPIFLLIAILIKRSDHGPIFFVGDRIGMGGRKFGMIKFRSMKVNAPDIRNSDGSTYNSESDARVTNIGKFLRESSLDEIPQLYNVLLGDMSIVGPRASTWDMLNTYQKDEMDKLKVKPGITGYCQAYYRNSLSAREKRVKDAWYANHVTFWLDLKIIVKTIETVLEHKSLYTKEK